MLQEYIDLIPCGKSYSLADLENRLFRRGELSIEKWIAVNYARLWIDWANGTFQVKPKPILP